jgi:hypothetical protein
MLTAVKDLLFYPDVFFMRIAREKVNLAPAIMIVGAGCLTGLAGTAICILFAGEYAGTTTLLMTLAGCTLPFIGWGIFSGVLFCISRVFSGSGSLISTLQNAGYGMLPWALSIVADVFIMLLFFGKSTVVYTSMWHTPQFAAFGVFLLSLVWSGYLWIYAIKHTHHISIYKAATAVILSVIVCFFMFTYGLPAI